MLENFRADNGIEGPLLMKCRVSNGGVVDGAQPRSFPQCLHGSGTGLQRTELKLREALVNPSEQLALSCSDLEQVPSHIEAIQ